MKLKPYLIKISLATWIALIPAIGSSTTEYDHQKDIVYGYKDGMALVMDVYSPKAELNKAGVIVIMAGGMTSNPIWSHNVGPQTDVQNLLSAGYVVFAAAHSSQPKYTADEIRLDIPRAVRFIRYNSKRFRIEPNKIGIMGYSSGGHVSLMTGLAPPASNQDSEDPVDLESSNVQAVVAYYPSSDLLNFGSDNRTILDYFKSVGYNLDAAFDFHQWDNKLNKFERVVGTEAKNEIYRINSPLTYVSSDDPPVLLIHGDKDQLVPIQQSELIAAKLKEMGVQCKLIVMEGQGHGWKNPLENELKEVLDWFNKHLLAK
jgi:acetyl esterase/lipase